MKKFAIWISFLMMCMTGLCGCGSQIEQAADTEGNETIADAAPDEEIIILYTNDVHCALDDNIGYAGVAAYKEECLKETPYVTLVDCGDAIQGGPVGTLSDGEAIIEIMNRVPYDLCVLGNHEFDYGMEQLQGLMNQSQVLYLGCNLIYNGENENARFSMKPYTLIKYGDVTVGFVGVMTPASIASSSLAVFQDDSGKVIYDFCGANDGADLYAVIQENVNACISEGADYVILLTHLGDTDVYSPYSSIDVAANTTGVDAILDGHAHHVIESEVVNNKEGNPGDSCRYPVSSLL
ncbi:MAG: bifunctional metallophosphatase/5'-nucleotidase [Roseburia sp.]